MAAGVNLGFGHDCVMASWYALGSAAMLEVAAMVVRGGAAVSRMAPATAELALPGRPAGVDSTRQPPPTAPGGAG